MDTLPEGRLPSFSRFVEATPLSSSGCLTSAQVRSWREAGLVCIEGLFDAELVAQAVVKLELLFAQPSASQSAGVLREHYM